MKTKRNKSHSLSLILCAVFLLMSHSLAFSQQSAGNEVLSNEVILSSEYVRVTSLPDGNRQLALSQAPTKMRAALMRFHLALQLVKNANFMPDQVDAILDSIGVISDEYYDHPSRGETAGQKKMLLSLRSKFTDRQVFEIFGGLRMDDGERAEVQKFLDFAKMSDSERRKVFQLLDPASKRQIWQYKLAVVLATEELNERGRLIFSDGIRLLESPTIYTKLDPTEANRLKAELEKRAIETLPKDLFMRAFVSITGSLSCGSNPVDEKSSISLAPQNCGCSYSE